MKWLSDQILKDLEKEFSQIEDQFELIQKIDLSIRSSKDFLDRTLKSICTDLKNMSGAESYEICIYSNEEFLPMGFSNIFEYAENFIKDSGKQIIDKIINGNCYFLLNDHLKKNFLFLPIIIKKKLFACIILEEINKKSKASLLNKNRFKSFANMASKQLGFLVEKLIENHEKRCQEKLIATFFNDKLKPSICWQKIVNEIKHFLPNWRPLKISPPPKVQLLLYDEGNRYLTIVATQGDEPSETHILVDSSICGMLINDRKMNWLLVDPNKYPDHYRGFLIENMSKIPHSELAIPIKNGNNIIGIINLEHNDKNVFKDHHIEAVLGAVQFLAPFIAALKERYRRQRSKELSMLYVMTNLLKRTGSQYQHLLGHPIVKARLKIESLINIQDKKNQKFIKLTNDINRYIDEISESSDRFCQALPNYISYGPQDLIYLIEQAMIPFDLEKLQTNAHIDISSNFGNDIKKVYASQLLQEHIYNLIHNSHFAVLKALELKQIKHGCIKINVQSKIITDKLENPTASTHVLVMIKDNGGGVPKDKEHLVGTPGFTTKEEYGSGFGLAAAKDYMESIGGNLEYINHPGEGFIVNFYLQVYNKIIHEKAIYIQ